MPKVNALVEVRGHRWVVSDIDPSPDRVSTVVSLQLTPVKGVRCSKKPSPDEPTDAQLRLPLKEDA